MTLPQFVLIRENDGSVGSLRFILIVGWLISHLVLTAFPVLLRAQNALESAEKRHSFAQSYGGVDWLQIGDDGGTARAAIGGLHFWGHSDLFVRLSFRSIENTLPSGLTTRFFPSGETGGNVYPWALRKNSMRPFFGLSWMSSEFSVSAGTQGSGPKQQMHLFPIRGGLALVGGPVMLELMAQYFPRTQIDYPVADLDGNVTLQRFNIPSWQAGVSVRLLRDVTRGSADLFLRDAQRAESLRQQQAWNTFYGGVGFSSSFFTQDSEYNRQIRPGLQGHSKSTSFPEFHAGYHWAELDLLFDVLFRNMNSTVEGWGEEQRYGRRALTIEASKFLFDFHGFVPFLGVGASAEWLTFSDRPQQAEWTEVEVTRLRPSFVAGWDIRPARTTWWYIRTSLRYTAGLELTVNDQHVPMPDFEFDFFQLVLYPMRFGK